MGDDVEKEAHQNLVEGSAIRFSKTGHHFYCNMIETYFEKALPYLIASLCVLVVFILLPLAVSNHKQINTMVAHETTTTTSSMTTTTYTRIGIIHVNVETVST